MAINDEIQRQEEAIRSHAKKVEQLQYERAEEAIRAERAARAEANNAQEAARAAAQR